MQFTTTSLLTPTLGTSAVIESTAWAQRRTLASTLTTFNCPANHRRVLQRSKRTLYWQKKGGKRTKHPKSGELVPWTSPPHSLLYINQSTVKCLFLQGSTSKSITSLRPSGLGKPSSNSISNYHNEKKHLGPLGLVFITLKLGTRLVWFFWSNPEDDYELIIDALWPSLVIWDLWSVNKHRKINHTFLCILRFWTARRHIYVDDTVEYSYLMLPRVKILMMHKLHMLQGRHHGAEIRYLEMLTVI